MKIILRYQTWVKKRIKVVDKNFNSFFNNKFMKNYINQIMQQAESMLADFEICECNIINDSLKIVHHLQKHQPYSSVV